MTHKQEAEDEVLREWRETAFFWHKHIDTLRTMLAPVTQALINDAGLAKGDNVLDVAGGSGDPSLSIAEAIGPTGVVTCTDVIPEMVANAQTEAERRGVTNILFKQCSADSLPFDDNSFDAVFCRLGVMFFPDPLAALREILRVTKPVGVVALAVWGKSELNPFSYVVTNVVSRILGETAPAEPNAPGAFRFAEPGSLVRILEEAGWGKVQERVLKFELAAPISVKQFWIMRSEASGALREKLARLPASQVERIAEEVQQGAREFFPNERMSLPAQMLIVTGRKALSS